MDKRTVIAIAGLIVLIAAIIFFYKQRPVKRPQEPDTPYPYHSEEVFFKNHEAEITLAGTLTRPKKDGQYPAAILITGSGPQNRDEELLGHKPFLILADHLTRKGIAVLRYDDRGFGMSSGTYEPGAIEDFASDVKSAVAFLKSREEIGKIGLIGHSEGGMVGPIVASQSDDINFMILLAAPGIPMPELGKLQQETIDRASGISEKRIQEVQKVYEEISDVIDKSNQIDTLHSWVKRMLRDKVGRLPSHIVLREMSDDKYFTVLTSVILLPQVRNFITYNPQEALREVKCPVLAINGAKDLQVPSRVNLEGIRISLNDGGNFAVEVKELKNLNHLFQNCNTGLPVEYEKIEETFAPQALKEVSNWILKNIDS